MSTTRKPSLVVAVFLCLMTTLVLAQHSPKGKAAESATSALLQMHSSYQQANATQKQLFTSTLTASPETGFPPEVTDTENGYCRPT
jgi:hypothetical protein